MVGTDEYYKKIQGAKSLQKIINNYIKAGNTKNWSMNVTRQDLDDMAVLS